MNVKIIVCLFIVFGASLAAKKVKQRPENVEETYGEFDEDVPSDDFEDDVPPDDLEENKEAARIKSKPQELFAQLGETIWLPCETTSTEGVLFWKKEQAYLYQGPISFGAENNTKLYDNGTLSIRLDSKNDFGTYTCQLILTKENCPSVNHTIVQLSKPVITSVTANDNRTVFKLGERLVLSCTATGNPRAQISWHKGNHPSTNLDIRAETIEIPSLKWSDAGMYRCLAENGVEPAAHDHITINVEHPPVVTTDKYFINSNHKESAELKCTVHGYPPPKGGWKRHGENIRKSNKYDLMTKKHGETEEYILIIKDLGPSDFDVYTCAAKNDLGKDQKNVTLVPTPVLQDLKPDQKDRDIVITWKVDSKKPVTEHEFQFRKKGETEWRVHDGSANSTKMDDSSNTVLYTLIDLEPGSYESRVRSKNEYGWSAYSDTMSFEAPKPGSSTHKHHKKHHKEKEQKERRLTSHSSEAIPSQAQESEHRDLPVKAADGSSGNNLIGSSTLTMISIILLFLHRNRQ